MSTFRELIQPTWERWCLYKKQQHRFTYKSEDSEQTALKRLHKYSGGNIKKAELVIDNAIAAGWMGFQELKGKESTRHAYKTIKTAETGFRSAWEAVGTHKDPIAVKWFKIIQDTIKDKIGNGGKGATDLSYYTVRKYKRFRNNEKLFTYKNLCDLIFDLEQTNLKNELQYVENALMISLRGK